MEDSAQRPETIRRRQARSGKISYGDPIILYESSRRRVVAVPLFIPHSDHSELAVKLITYLKRPPPMEWDLVEENSLTLQEDAARCLLNTLRTHLKVA
jgi:hypothetical protein